MDGTTGDHDGKRSGVLQDLDKAINLSRFPDLPLALFLISYTPLGLFLTLLRACMSLQAILLLLLFPEGTIKRYLLRIFFGVLGIVVTTEGLHRRGSNTKVFVSNRLSYVDHIALHLAFDCVTVSTEGKSPPLFTALFPHHIFNCKDDEDLQSEAKCIPQFDENESVVDFTPFLIQPEYMPTNGSHMLLQFSSWPFALDSVVQPVAISVTRPFGGIKLTTAGSSGWWDLFWTVFVPFTVFHIKMLPPLECENQEKPQEFARRAQHALADDLGVKHSDISKEDVEKWLAGPPPSPPMPKGPIIQKSEFSSLPHSSPEIESMVQRVTAILPQVPHAVIRKDLVETQNVDATISNIVEGRVKYDSIPTLQQVAATNTPPPSSSNGSKSTGSKKTSLFSKRSSSALSSMQRQLSLEERKKNLMEQARRRYIAKHGLQPKRRSH